MIDKLKTGRASFPEPNGHLKFELDFFFATLHCPVPYEQLPRNRRIVLPMMREAYEVFRVQAGRCAFMNWK